MEAETNDGNKRNKITEQNTGNMRGYLSKVNRGPMEGSEDIRRAPEYRSAGKRCKSGSAAAKTSAPTGKCVGAKGISVGAGRKMAECMGNDRKVSQYVTCAFDR